MPNADRDMPAATRPASEIAFVLRRAKWRHGPDVLRDVARAQAAAEEASAPLASASSAARKPARKR